MSAWLVTTCLVVALSLVPLASPAADDQLPSCEELDQMAATLDEAAESLDSIGSITEGSDLDKALGDLVNALAEVARTENDKELYQAVDTMGTAWQNNQWDAMKVSLDQVIKALDNLWDRDCR